MIPVVVEKIEWTSSAKYSFEKIIIWIEKNWSKKEVDHFILRTEKMINKLQRYPESCRPSQKRKDVRIGILDKHTQLIYHYNARKKSLTILLFWGMKQNPLKFKY